jgi:hypothetical protein
MRQKALHDRSIDVETAHLGATTARRYSPHPAGTCCSVPPGLVRAAERRLERRVVVDELLVRKLELR